MPDDQVVIDTDTYIAALRQQRTSALDTVAQLEGIIATLRKEIAALRNQVEAGTAKPATANMYTTAEPATPPVPDSPMA